tara:strand:+ start:912 stop:1373 length:462 start_codon:yes stop_codon:yes gene_type:complete
MASITVEKHINAPIETVFAKASDVRNWAEQVEAITKIEVHADGPVGNGTRFTETRVMWGKEASETMTFADFDPPNGFTLLASSHGTDYVSTHRFEPEGDGTKMTLRFESTPRTLGAKLMGVMFAFMKKSVCGMLEKDMDDLASACETDASGAA